MAERSGGDGHGRLHKHRVLIVDDHAIVREGVVLLLEREPDFAVAAEAGALAEALEVATSEVDVIVADLVLGDAQGAGLVKALQEHFDGAPVLVLSMVDVGEEVRDALAAGASGYVLKHVASTELLDALRDVVQGRPYLQPSLGPLVGTHASHARDAEQLTGREREVLRLVALGHTNIEVGELLHLSVRTVETHRASIMRKLDFESRADLVRFALDTGLIR